MEGMPDRRADGTEDRRLIRELVENWVVWRDAGDWERFRTVWHDDGRDDGDLVPGHRRRVHRHKPGRLGAGRQHPALPRRHHHRPRRRPGDRADQDDDLAARPRWTACCATWSAPAASTTSSRSATAHWGIVLRQPIYEKDRMDPVDPAPADAGSALLREFPGGLPAPGLSADADRLHGEAGHARPERGGGRGPVRAWRSLAAR